MNSSTAVVCDDGDDDEWKRGGAVNGAGQHLSQRVRAFERESGFVVVRCSFCLPGLGNVGSRLRWTWRTTLDWCAGSAGTLHGNYGVSLG